MKMQFTNTPQLAAYASPRMGGDKPYKDKTRAEQAWTTIAQLCSSSALPEVKETLLQLAPHARSATRERLYRFVAERIVGEASSY
jgi:hypothetical protein